MDCLICDRIEQIKQGLNPYVVAELETGYVVLGDHQHFYGYTLFLYKDHLSELFDIADKKQRLRFLEEMSMVAEAVQLAFPSEKLNYELLGMGAAHMHWHIFPRREGDTPIRGPVWWLPPEEMWDEKEKPSSEELIRMKNALRSALETVQDNNNTC